MKAWCGFLTVTVLAVGASAAYAQTPVLGGIEAPYSNLQTSVKIASTQWGPGTVAYGAVGTPLVLSGSNLGGSGIVQFIAYKNGAVDTNDFPVSATVTMWSPTMLILTVPSGAYSGLVTVTTDEGKTSNGLPFMVTPGAYAGTCPAGPTATQLQITTTALHDGTVSQAYSASLSATGGTTAYTWSITSGTLPAGLSLNTSTGGITGTPTTASGPTDVTVQVKDSGSPQQTNAVILSLTVEPQTLTASTVYSYTANSFDGVGNITSYTDSIMGTWNMNAPGSGSGYDSLNRLMAANASWPDGTQQSFCWQYDNFGNRLQQVSSSAAFQSGSGGTAACTAQSSATLLGSALASYNTNNQISSTNARGITWTPAIDAAGNMQSDGANTYLYDAEGRVCAIQSEPIPGNTALTGYIYDADGTRVAKGSITTMSCDPGSNGFQLTESYVLGPGGEELTMLDGNNNWQRTNVYGAGKLLATYDTVSNPTYATGNGQPTQIPALHFQLTDALGTRRMQTSAVGQPETDIQSLPFGDQLNSFPDQYAPSTADDATPLHFTGKERDTESGNDYFGARYYASSMGRFMSPDWAAKAMPVPYASFMNPQSLNLYSYMGNNPLSGTDLDGHLGCGFLWLSNCPNPPPAAPPPPPPTNVAGALPPAPPPRPAPKPASLTSLLPHGVGILLGVDVAVGLEADGHLAGAAAQASLGAGGFAGGDQGVNGGVFGTYGVAASGVANGGDPSQTNSTPPMVVGAGGNGGVSPFFTNGTSEADLNGIFSTTTITVSATDVGGSVQFSIGKNGAGNTIWMLSGGYAPGLAAYVSSIVTNTVPIHP